MLPSPAFQSSKQNEVEPPGGEWCGKEGELEGTRPWLSWAATGDEIPQEEEGGLPGAWPCHPLAPWRRFGEETR